jgi:hypothetical protein
VLGWVSGWKKLTASYPVISDISGKRFSFRSGQFGFGINYNGCLSFTAGASSLQVSILFVFRPGHRSFRVPWGDITATIKSGRIFPVVGLRFAKQNGIELRISKKLATALAAASGRQLRLVQDDG